MVVVALGLLLAVLVGPAGDTTVKQSAIVDRPGPVTPLSGRGRAAKPPCAEDPARRPRPPAPDGTPANYLHTCGSRLYDAAGREVQITGLSWFGQETARFAPHGLDRRNWRSLLDQVATLGFNTVRLPYTNEMLRPGARVSGVDYQLNPDLRDLGPIELLDRLVEGARERGLRVILDRHRPDSSGQSALWYTDRVSEERWIDDWRMLARRYRGNDAVIGVDLHNEPKAQATWGSGDPATDWRLAAERAGNAVLEENPYLLVFVQGIQWSPWVSHWWGGNLRAAREHPIRLRVPNRVVYSPHDYGPSVFPQPWFWDADFPANLPALWDGDWGYLHKENVAPVVVGEFGGRSTGPDREGMWQQALVDYLRDNGIGYLHWSLNPDSADTGGILADDWRTVQSERMALLARHLAPPLGAATAGALGPAQPRLTVLARNATAHEASGLRLELRLRNEGPEAVALAGLELRYPIPPAAGARDARVTVETKGVPDREVVAEIVWEGAGSGRYLRLTFGPQAGVVAAYGESGEVALRLESGATGENLAERNALPGAELAPEPRFALYRDGALVWGDAVAAPLAPGSAALPAAARLPMPPGSAFWAGASYSLPPGHALGSAAGPSRPGTAAAVDADLANLAGAGARVIKWRVFGAANLPREANGEPGRLGADFFADLDAALALAERHDLHLVLSIFDPALLSASCSPGSVAAGDLRPVLGDGGQRGALLDRIVLPLIEGTAANPRVLGYELLAQPEAGWPGNEQAVRSFLREAAAAVRGKGRPLATVLAAPESLGRLSGLGLDYYSVRWSDQLAAQPSWPNAAALKLDRPVVVGELAANGPRHGIGEVLSFALREGYAGAFAGGAGEDDGASWRGELFAWARRHQAELGTSGRALPDALPPPRLADYGVDHLRLATDGQELTAELRLRTGHDGDARVTFAVLPADGTGQTVAAEKALRLVAGKATPLRLRLPGLDPGRRYQLSAALWDGQDKLLARFDRLASFVVRDGDLASGGVDSRGGPDCLPAPARGAGGEGAHRLASILSVPLVPGARQAGSEAAPAGEIEVLDGTNRAALEHLPPGARKEAVVENAELPVALAFAPDGRLFFGEQHTGRIRIVERGAVRREPFYTLTVSGQPQAGLLGLAVDPDFKNNRYVYVLYTAAQGDRPGGLNGANRLLRLTEMNGRGTAPQLVAADLPSDFVFAGGGLRFGPDGGLYLGLGAGLNQAAAADPRSLAGKVLRYSPEVLAVNPADPAAARGQPATYASGLGSPFGLAFHPVAHQLYVTDGGGGFDELNLVLHGGSYGAPAVGVQRRRGQQDPLIAQWPARGISGLDFYRGSRLAGWQDDLFYCNARRGELHRVQLAGPAFDQVTSDEVVTTGCQFAVADGPDGALYFSDERGIYRIVDR